MAGEGHYIMRSVCSLLALCLTLGQAGTAMAACNMTEVCSRCYCEGNKSVTCDSLFLEGKAFFPGICDSVTELLILNSDITDINDTDMAHLVNLKTFQLANSPVLAQVSENAFAKLAKLEMLELQNNSLTTLLPQTFVGLSSIQQITVTDSLISSITTDQFSHLNGTLQMLTLNNNQINSTQAFFNTTNVLTQLDLSNNLLKTVGNTTFSYLSNVTGLSLEGNLLQDVPSATFDAMTSLQMLNLATNGLSGFPGDLFLNSSIQTLNVSNNNFNSIPIMTLSKMDNLQVLDLGSNMMATLKKDAISSLFKLRELHLSNSSFLTSVDDGAFATQASLEKIYLSDNPFLQDIHPNAFSENLPSLKELYINDNGLKKIPGNIFNGTLLSGLEVVEAQGNPLLCSCDVTWMRLYMEDEGISWILPWKEGDKAVVCESPERFNGTLVFDTDPDTLTCDLPEILKDEQYLETNDENYFMEVLVAEGLPTTKWKAVNGEVLENGDVYDPGTGNDRITVQEKILSNKTVLSQLYINHPTVNSKGYYTFIATNAGGTTQKQYLAKPPDLPEHKIKTGLIIGLVIGGVVILGLVIAVIYLARKQGYKRMVEEQPEESEQPTYGSVDRLVNETESPPPPGHTEEA